MTISGFAAYVKQLWKNKPDTSTPLSAERLTHMEGGIKGNSDAIEKLAAAVVSQIANDPDKIASMAALYAVNEYAKSVNKRVDDTNSNLVSEQFSLGIVSESITSKLSVGFCNLSTHEVTIIFVAIGSRTSEQGIFSVPSKYLPPANTTGVCGLIKADGTTSFGNCYINRTDGRIYQNITGSETISLFGIIKYIF